MTSFSSYCPVSEPFKISKANGIRFVYNTEGDFYYGQTLDDNVLFNEDPFCGSQSEYFAQPVPCDGIIRLQIVWCDPDSIPYLGFYDVSGGLITSVAGSPSENNYYEWDINLNDDAALCEQCITLKIFRVTLPEYGPELNTVNYNVLGPGLFYTSSLFTLGDQYVLSFTVALSQVEIQQYPPATAIGTYTPGTYSVTFTATSNFVRFNIFAANALTNVSIKRYVAPYNLVEATSEPLRISSVHNCLVKIEYWNDDAYDNIDYSLGYKNIMYAPLTFGMAKFPEESKVYLKSNGTTKKLSGRLKKVTPIKTDYIPQYMHEKMAIIFSHDNVEINGTAYVKEGEYTIDAVEKFTLAQGGTDLTKTIYNYLNSNCD